MSTKIYNAFEYKGKMSDLMQFLYKLKEKLIKQDIKILQRGLNMPLYSAADDNQRIIRRILECNPNLTESSPLKDFSSFVIRILLEELMESGLNTSLNLRKEACIFFYKKRILVQFFSLPNDLMQGIYKDKSFVDFHYQDQTDPYYKDKEFKNLSPLKLRNLKRNYKIREQVWDEIYKTKISASEVALTYDFITKNTLNEIIRQAKI